MRTRTVITFSCLAGILAGTGLAYAALTVNGWNPVLEYKKQSELIKEIAQKSENPNAKASIESTEFDFGIRDVKEKGKQDFYIRNIGTAPLTLEVNRTTCTCTGIDLSTKRLAPGKTAVATVHYDAERATTGPYNQGGTIVTNDADMREIYLSIKGIFTAPIVMNPGEVVFPTVPAGDSRSRTIRIYGYEKTPLELRTPQWNDKEHFDLVLNPSHLNEEDEKDSMRKYATSVYDAKITVKQGLPIGTFQEKFTVKTNYPSESVFEFLARGQVSGSFVSIAGMGYNKERGIALIGKVSQGQRLSRDFMLQFTGSTASRVRLAVKETNPDWLKVSLNEPRDIGRENSLRRLYTVSIEIPIDAPLGNYMKTDEENAAFVMLDTGLEEAPSIRIPLELAVER